jgi:hypothetical protein
MPKQDAAAILGEILSEADALIRLRLKEQNLELPHLVVGATPGNQIVVRSNGDREVMRSFGEDLQNVADETDRTTGARRHDSLGQFALSSRPTSAV